MKRVQFLMIGGFLGAGKTTAIARLARHYVDAGRSVGLVTNDQAYDLVDTRALQSQGFRVGEVPGACFCCKFDDLVQTVEELSAAERPDIVIAEPVGSCTDLVATVIQPLDQLHGDRYETGPLVVLLKPEHGRKILAEQPGGGFSPNAAYIFLKQIEEADVVVVHKADKLSERRRQELVDMVVERFPGKEVIAASARTGLGFDALQTVLETAARPRRTSMDVDYDVYAEGEAELGWLNATLTLSRGPGGGTFELDRTLIDLVSKLQSEFHSQQVEPAHLKVLGHSDTSTAIANLVASGASVELSRASNQTVGGARFIVNARVAVAPETLRRTLDQVLQRLAAEDNLTATMDHVQSLRPGRPVPTHRVVM